MKIGNTVRFVGAGGVLHGCKGMILGVLGNNDAVPPYPYHIIWENGTVNLCREEDLALDVVALSPLHSPIW